MVLLLMSLLVIETGCVYTHKMMTQRAAALATISTRPLVELKPAKRIGEGNPLYNRFVKRGRLPSPRAQLLLRKYNLLPRYEQDLTLCSTF